MELKDSENTYGIHPIQDGNNFFIGISKNGIQVGNPSIDPSQLARFIQELKRMYVEMAEI